MGRIPVAIQLAGGPDTQVKTSSGIISVVASENTSIYGYTCSAGVWATTPDYIGTGLHSHYGQVLPDDGGVRISYDGAWVDLPNVAFVDGGPWNKFLMTRGSDNSPIRITRVLNQDDTLKSTMSNVLMYNVTTSAVFRATVSLTHVGQAYGDTVTCGSWSDDSPGCGIFLGGYNSSNYLFCCYLQ